MKEKVKKKLIKRSALGFPLGIAIGYIITIFISLLWADGHYSSCEPELISVMGNEINAVILQAFLCGLLGTGFAAGSVIWEFEHWSIVRQTGIYFLSVSVIMMPIAWFTHWMEHSITGFLSYLGVFVLIFIFIWITLFMIGKRNVEKMNAGLHKAQNDERK